MFDIISNKIAFSDEYNICKILLHQIFMNYNARFCEKTQ